MSSTEVLTETIDPGSDRPIYKQIADHLRSAIELAPQLGLGPPPCAPRSATM